MNYLITESTRVVIAVTIDEILREVICTNCDLKRAFDKPFGSTYGRARAIVGITIQVVKWVLFGQVGSTVW